MIESSKHCQQLLELARRTVKETLGVKGHPTKAPPIIKGRHGGAFVTLWTRGHLRGCVGTFAATHDVVKTIVEVTRSSLVDSRFQENRLTVDDLDALNIEISILSDPQTTKNPLLELIPGTHGVIIAQGDRSGCFLPKVAIERGWSAEEFLNNCCTMKAGFAREAWRDPDTTVQFFTAQVFSESSVT